MVEIKRNILHTDFERIFENLIPLSLTLFLVFYRIYLSTAPQT